MKFMKKLFNKEKKSFQEQDLKCPRCNIIMRKVRKHDVVIDVCNKCNGMWLDDNEIEKLVMIGKKEQNLKEHKHQDNKKSNKKVRK